MSQHFRGDGRPKLAFFTEREAVEHAAKFGDQDAIHVYRCGVCTLWHYAHKRDFAERAAHSKLLRAKQKYA